MTEYTIRMLRIALARLPQQVMDLPARAVIKTAFQDRGPLEGCFTMDHVAITGLAVGNEGLLLFTDQSGNTNRQGALPQIPGRFETGNPEIDEMRRDQGSDDTGEEWKKG